MQPAQQQQRNSGLGLCVPLEDCILCDDEPEFERVPLLVRTCCSIVEERGLEIVGVYRVPGNSAAVNNLTDQGRKGELGHVSFSCRA